MLSPAIARELAARGHDVQAVAGHQEISGVPMPTSTGSSRPWSALEAKLAQYPGDEDLANGEDWL